MGAANGRRVNHLFGGDETRYNFVDCIGIVKRLFYKADIQ
jgi:hypothetical protein